MIRNSNELCKRLFNLRNSLICARNSSSTNQLALEKLENESEVEIIDDEPARREASIELKRNKSRLKEHDRKFLLEENPYPDPKFHHHGTLKFNRRLYGRYGAASGVNPSLCWPTKQELQESIEYEQVKYPFTIQEVVKEAKQKRTQKQEDVAMRQANILKKMEKLEQWKQELHDRIEKKEGEAKEARARKERLIEEVRRHFGFSVDPKDERFKEMLEKKEKEQRKEMKEARKKAKEDKMVEKLAKPKTDVEEN